MRAAARFVEHWLDESGRLQEVKRIRAEVFGSLALTGRGHGTDKAVLMCLEGQLPNLIDPDIIPAALERTPREKRVLLGGTHAGAFGEQRGTGMNKRQNLPCHTPGTRFLAFSAGHAVVSTLEY